MLLHLRELGKIGAKVMGWYLLTTVLAIGVGAAIFFLFKPGTPGMPVGAAGDVQAIVEKSQQTNISLRRVGNKPACFVILHTARRDG